MEKIENSLKMLGEELDILPTGETEIKAAVKELLNPNSSEQLANLDKEQIDKIVMLISYNELRMKPFKKIYAANMRVIKSLLNLSKSKDSNAFNRLSEMYRDVIHNNTVQLNPIEQAKKI